MNELEASLRRLQTEYVDLYQVHTFDPNVHEAVLQQPSRDLAEGTVISELSRGYRIRDRVLRPSKVAVSVKPAAH